MYLFCLMTLAFADVTLYRVVDEAPIAARVGVPAPLAFLEVDGEQRFLGSNYRLYTLSGSGGIAQLSESGYSGAAFRGFYAGDRQFLIVEQNGYRHTAVNLQGEQVRSATLARPSDYTDQKNQIRLLPDDGDPAAVHSIHIYWRQGDLERQVPLLTRSVAEAQAGFVPYTATRLQPLGRSLLITTTHGYDGRLHYALLDLDSGEARGSSIPVSEPASRGDGKEMPVLLAGLTATGNDGFVFTLAGESEGRRRALVFGGAAADARVLHFEALQADQLNWLHPLGGERWLAWRPSGPVSFRVVPQ